MMKAKIEAETGKPGKDSQCPFSIHNQDVACREWGWPNDKEHWKMVVLVLEDFFKMVCGYKFRIRSVLEPVPDVHHGIGDRYDDPILVDTFNGILTKQFDQVAKSGDRDAKKQMAAAKEATKEARANNEVMPDPGNIPKVKHLAPPQQKKPGFWARLMGKGKFEQNAYS